MKIHDCKQYTTAWSQLRLGKITASDIDKLVSPTGKTRIGEMPAKYLYLKVAEKLLGWSPESLSTFDMTQGSLLEGEARGWAMLEKNLDIREVGFVESEDGRCGFSPDGLISDVAGIEIKSPSPAIQIGYLDKGELPADYVLQVQFSLWLSGFPTWYFLSYCRSLPPLFLTVSPDAELHKSIAEAVSGFCGKFDALYGRLKAIQDAENAAKEAAYHEANPNR